MKYLSPTAPMRHQVELTNKMRGRDAFALLLEMGCGKTKPILDEWQESCETGGPTDLLVIAKKATISNWYESKSEEQRSEMETHLDPAFLRTVAVGVWGKSASAKRKLEWMLSVRTRPRVMFTHVEAISASRGAEEACREFLSVGRATMVVDESTTIRARKSERTKAIVRLGALARRRRIMTGLVTPKSPLDLYWQFYFLDWRILGFQSHAAFRNRYAVVEKQCFLPQGLIRDKLRAVAHLKDGASPLGDSALRAKLTACYGGGRQVPASTPRRQVLQELGVFCDGASRQDLLGAIERLGGYLQGTVMKITGFKNLEELQQKIAPHSYRALKSECLDLKPKIYQFCEVEMTDEQRRVYDEIVRRATAQLDSGEFLTTKQITDRLLMLHRVTCGHARDEDGVVRDVKSNRCQAVLDVLEEHSGKAVVWVCYDREIRKVAAAIREEYGEDSVSCFWGGNVSTRAAEEREFLSDPRRRFMCATQAAGGFGNNWVAADLAIYAANTYDLELRSQSEDRCHRKGQRSSVTYVDLICRGTIEEKIVQCLRRKLDLSAQVTGESAREWLV